MIIYDYVFRGVYSHCQRRGHMIFFFGGGGKCPRSTEGVYPTSRGKNTCFSTYLDEFYTNPRSKFFFENFFVDPRVRQYLPHFDPWDPSVGTMDKGGVTSKDLKSGLKVPHFVVFGVVSKSCAKSRSRRSTNKRRGFGSSPGPNLPAFRSPTRWRPGSTEPPSTSCPS